MKLHVARVIVITAALLGAYVSGMLMSQHDGGWQASAGPGILLNFCNDPVTGAKVCDEVISSRFGAFDFVLGSKRFEVPTSFIGFAYFVAVSILAMCTPREWLAHGQVRLTVVAASVTSAAASIFLTAVMVMQVQVWCPLCGLAHLCNLGVIGASIAACRIARGLDAGGPQPLARWNPMPVGLAILVASAGAWAYFESMIEVRRQWRKARDYALVLREMRDDPEFVKREFYAQEKHGETGITGDAVPVALFLDLSGGGSRCFVRRWNASITPLLGHEVALQVRSVAQVNGPTKESRAFASARLRGGDELALQFATRILEHREHGDEDFARVAKEVGLQGSQLLSDMYTPATEALLAEDRFEAAAFDIQAGPAVVVGGRRVPDLCLSSGVFWESLGIDLRDGRKPSDDHLHDEIVADTGVRGSNVR